MKNFIKAFGVIAMVAVMVSLSSCAMLSSIGGTAEPHGFFTGNGATASVTQEGASEIASYSVILGLVDSGYPSYAATVKAAEAEGKQITTVTKWMLFLVKTTAYAKANG